MTLEQWNAKQANLKKQLSDADNKVRENPPASAK